MNAEKGLVSMENLQFRFQNGQRRINCTAQIAGVVSSGNLEVLFENLPLAGACEVQVQTAALGFGAIWQAVLDDFHQRWQLADARISIHDAGATPAVVSLRLDQVVAAAINKGVS
jgi:malonate decarboxylase delta subunit